MKLFPSVEDSFTVPNKRHVKIKTFEAFPVISEILHTSHVMYIVHKGCMVKCNVCSYREAVFPSFMSPVRGHQSSSKKDVWAFRRAGGFPECFSWPPALLCAVQEHGGQMCRTLSASSRASHSLRFGLWLEISHRDTRAVPGFADEEVFICSCPVPAAGLQAV